MDRDLRYHEITMFIIEKRHSVNEKPLFSEEFFLSRDYHQTYFEVKAAFENHEQLNPHQKYPKL